MEMLKKRFCRSKQIIIPKYKEVPVFVIKNNMRIIGMNREEYLALLENV